MLAQIHIQLGPRREFVIWILACIFTKKKYFTDYRVTQQETNRHSNIKQKPEITNKNTRKRTCQYGQIQG